MSCDGPTYTGSRASVQAKCVHHCDISNQLIDGLSVTLLEEARANRQYVTAEVALLHGTRPQNTNCRIVIPFPRIQAGEYKFAENMYIGKFYEFYRWYLILIIIIFINCNWVVTRWQWLFYTYTNMGGGSN